MIVIFAHSVFVAAPRRKRKERSGRQEKETGELFSYQTVNMLKVIYSRYKFWVKVDLFRVND